MSTEVIQDIQQNLQYLTQEVDSLFFSVNQAWQFLTFMVLFLMGLGFAMLECGSVRYKSHARKNILLKNMWDSLITGVLFYFLSWGLAFGNGDNGFIGTEDFLIITTSNWANWLYQWVFMNSTLTIVSGAMAERVHVLAYSIYVVWNSLIVYPVIAHWMWGPGGWLQSKIGQYGALDFAGGLVVHGQGGAVALIGAILIGPRIGRFTGVFDDCDITASSAPDQVLGMFLLWTSWYPFNMGSTLSVTNGWEIVAGHAGVATTLSACTCGLVSIILGALWRKGELEVGDTVNGVIAGLVAITPACGYVPIWAAFPIGIVAAFVWFGFSILLQKLHIDDPLDAGPVHLGCGVWGALAIGLFGDRQYISFIKGVSYWEMEEWGAFMGGGGKLLGIQLLAAITIVSYSLLMGGIVWLFCKAIGILRVSEAIEMSGLVASVKRAERES